MNDLDTSSFDPDALPPREDGLALLANDAMRARRRPIAIAWVWAFEAAAAFVVAMPASQIVRALYGAHPRGDAALWTPGGLELFDFVVDAAAARSSFIVLAALVIIGAAVLGLLPLGALIASIAFATRTKRAPLAKDAFARGGAGFGAFLLLLAGATSLQLVLLLGGTIAAVGLSSGMADRLGEARADQLAGVGALVFLAVAMWVGIAHDLARAAAIRFRVGAMRAAGLGLSTLRRAPASLAFSWGWRALAGLVPIAVGALLADRVGARAGGALALLFAVHQSVVVTRVALRASWLAKALRAVDHAHRVVRVPRGGD